MVGSFDGRLDGRFDGGVHGDDDEEVPERRKAKDAMRTGRVGPKMLTTVLMMGED